MKRVLYPLDVRNVVTTIEREVVLVKVRNTLGVLESTVL